MAAPFIWRSLDNFSCLSYPLFLFSNPVFSHSASLLTIRIMATRLQPSDEAMHPKDQPHHHHPQASHADPVQLTSGLGHQMSPTDPGNPQNWQVVKKLYASVAAMAFAFAV